MKCWLKVITYRYIQTPVFSESTVFARLDRIVSLSILSSRLSSNSCSAALICVFVLREEFAFLFQTFSRSDPPGKAPLTRGRYVKKKEEEKKDVMRSRSIFQHPDGRRNKAQFQLVISHGLPEGLQF